MVGTRLAVIANLVGGDSEMESNRTLLQSISLITILSLGVLIIVACERNSNREYRQESEGRAIVTESDSAEWVTLDGYDSASGTTVRTINLWKSYTNRSAGVATRASHGARVKKIRRSGDGILVETAQGKRGWVTYYFIKELK